MRRQNAARIVMEELETKIIKLQSDRAVLVKELQHVERLARLELLGIRIEG